MTTIVKNIEKPIKISNYHDNNFSKYNKNDISTNRSDGKVHHRQTKKMWLNLSQPVIRHNAIANDLFPRLLLSSVQKFNYFYLHQLNTSLLHNSKTP